MSETSSRLIIKADHQVLMSLGDTGSIKFIGGRMRAHETPRQAAIREAREEGGVDLSPSDLYELPYQDNDPKRHSYWFGVDTYKFAAELLNIGDDVLSLFSVSLSNVEDQLTYDNWKEHWRENLLPALLGH